jgi:hypothetical protein
MYRASAFVGLALCLGGCTLQHSKQALHPELPASTPTADARFVTEEDSGLSILGMFMLAEPDHYAVLLERLRRDHRCGRLLYPQLDFYTDHWLLIAFPISRITALCEPEQARPIPAVSAPAPASTVTPSAGEVAPYSAGPLAPTPSEP